MRSEKERKRQTRRDKKRKREREKVRERERERVKERDSVCESRIEDMTHAIKKKRNVIEKQITAKSQLTCFFERERENEREREKEKEKGRERERKTA